MNRLAPVALHKPWQWLPRALGAVATDGAAVLRLVRAKWAMLWAVTRIELLKRYAGSFLGVVWIPFYAALHLGTLAFVYGVVFSGSAVAEYKGFDYVLFIFAGLVPYLGFNDAIAQGVGCIKGNIALVKNTVFPVELVPIKTVLAALMGHAGTFAILLLLLAARGHVSLHWLWLPVPLLLLLLAALGMVWFLSAAAVLVPDLTYIVNLTLLLAMFLSPIGFTLESLKDHPAAGLLLYLNPLTYLIDEFRFALLGYRMLPLWTSAVALGVAFLLFFVGASFFRRMTRVFSDYE
jgi:lipopolysaccharide transport system permease protein